MAPNDRLFSLPVVTALHALIGGIYEGGESIGVSIKTHAHLDDFFGAIGIEVANAPSIDKKVRATVQRLNSSRAEHKDLIRVIEQLVDPRNHPSSRNEPTVDYLNAVLRADGYEVSSIGDRYRLVATGLNTVAAVALTEKADILDLAAVRADFERAVSETDRDPSDAITSACSTVESVCKCILDEMGKPHPTNKDIKGLVGEVAKHLHLSPGRDDLPKEWEQDIRTILSGLFNVISGIGSLRTHAGDAHGRGKKPVPADARIARLAVHAASTVSLFYIETWQRAKSPK